MPPGSEDGQIDKGALRRLADPSAPGGVTGLGGLAIAHTNLRKLVRTPYRQE